MQTNSYKMGFTLIELSIVLVIIGLIIGGVLVGKDLINIAAVRAQVTQIEKYNTAVNTFRGKYNDQLPGDIADPMASQFGFPARGTDCSGSACQGEGNGDGMVQGYDSFTASSSSSFREDGENLAFWVDLSTAGLIDGKFTLGTPTAQLYSRTLTTTPGVKDLFPAAKIGNGNFIYVWGNTVGTSSNGPYGLVPGANYFGIAAIYQYNWPASYSNVGMTVAQASYIDAKIDDNNPIMGRVLTLFLPLWFDWSPPSTYNSNVVGWSGTLPPPGAATAASCFNNNSTAGVQPHYSMEFSGGSGVNCAISIKFQ